LFGCGSAALCKSVIVERFRIGTVLEEDLHRVDESGLGRVM